MPSPSFKTIIQDKLWTILGNYGPFAELVLTGNRAQGSGDGWLREAMQKDINAYPRVSITDGRLTQSGLWVDDLRTYAMEGSDIPDMTEIGDMLVRRRYEFEIVVTGRDESTDLVSQIEETIHDALCLTGLRLGLDFVTGWGPILEGGASRNDDDSKELPPNRKRARSRWIMPVNIEHELRALT